MKWQSVPLSAVALCTLFVSGTPCLAQIPSSQRTADMPDSWLVLYNNDPASGGPAWKDWYIQQWGIPPENTLGLTVSSDERVTRDHFHARVFNPVRDFLNGRPELKAKIMGILVGYRVPGNFYLDATHPAGQAGGGWSVANKLTDMVYTTWYKRSNPHTFIAYSSPNYTRLTKASLTADCYLTARLDGPTLADVQAMTLRAKALTDAQSPLPTAECLYYDYLDIGAPAGDEWSALRATVQSSFLTIPAWRFPWRAYESENESMPSCAMSLSYYRTDNWNLVPWSGSPLGSRIAALAMNSWGATTVRSTTAHGGRYVPNALVNGQFAAAIGATAEPYTGSEPNPGTLVWCLAEGRTLGEAFFHANPYRNFMWEMVGDPLLRVPQWFVDPCLVLPSPSDLGPPEVTLGGETVDPRPNLSFTLSSGCFDSPVSFHVQVDDDPIFASPDVDYTSEALPAGPVSFTVGQIAGNGVYIAGGEGQSLGLGSYYWRVRAEDTDGASGWMAASADAPAFTVAEPLRLVRAVSRKVHGPAGTFDIELALAPDQPATTEPRRDGPTQIVLTFNRPIRADDGLLDGDEVELSGGLLTAVSVLDNELTISLANISDDYCLTVFISGITDMSGHPPSDHASLSVSTVMGDVTGNGLTTSTDLTIIKTMIGIPVDTQTSRFDLSLDGTITNADLTITKSMIGKDVVCP